MTCRDLDAITAKAKERHEPEKKLHAFQRAAETSGDGGSSSSFCIQRLAP